MNDDPYADPFIRDAPSMGQVDIHLIAWVWIAGLVLLTLAVFIRSIAQTALRRETIARSVARRWLILTNAFGTLAALAVPLPMALAASVDGIASALICELIGAIVITLLALGLGAALALRATDATELYETRTCEDDDYFRDSQGVNPATGYPMINRSIDAGGYAFGCGPDCSDYRHWDR